MGLPANRDIPSASRIGGQGNPSKKRRHGGDIWHGPPKCSAPSAFGHTAAPGPGTSHVAIAPPAAGAGLPPVFPPPPPPPMLPAQQTKTDVLLQALGTILGQQQAQWREMMALAKQGPPPAAPPPCFNVMVHTDSANGPKVVTECVSFKRQPGNAPQGPSATTLSATALASAQHRTKNAQ